jgi:large subunit ribosomal protein L11
MAQPNKEVTNVIKLEIPAGAATPAPPLGPILGQNGIPIQDFCSQFNERTKEMRGDILPVVVTVFKDRTFKFEVKQPTVKGLILKKYGLQKGSGTPNKVKLKKINISELKEIAERKMPDLNTNKLDSAMRIVAGTARSMGLEVIE